ncbi:MAG: hypothetical protein H6550_03355 [Chitinophagales bacterium]|nr:hypothetical protein [Chitinophagales bacterium]
MKLSVLTILYSLFSTIGIAQVVAIQNDMEKNLRLCIGNHITVAVEGLAATEVLLSTNNGIIKQDEYLGIGHYIYHANVAGPAMIYIKKKVGNTAENIDSVEFYVRRMPVLPPKFAGKSSGEMDHSVILAQLGIIAPGDLHADMRFPVSSYVIAVYRNGKQIFNRKVEGPRIDQATIDFFHTLKNNDKLIFGNIYVKDCDGELRKTDSIHVIVKNAMNYEKVNIADTIYVEDPITGEIIEQYRDSIWQQRSKHK